MPEGDTVRRLAERIGHRFVGDACIRSIARDPRITHLDLTHRRLIEADAAGKWLLLRFDDGRTLFGHLRMDGRWDIGRRSRAPEWKRRLEVEFASGWLTAVDLPVIGVVATVDEQLVIGHLGPDLCGPTAPDVDEIVRRLVRAGAQPLAGALLDQRNVAGFGNVYAVEIPFICGVSPFQPVETIDGLDLVVRVGCALIRTNAERGPQNTTGRRLHQAHHWVYGRRRQPCPWCSTQLHGTNERDSPWQRTTTWCPSCQPITARRRVDDTRVERALALHPAHVVYRRATG